jgi:hypothetical protein
MRILKKLAIFCSLDENHVYSPLRFFGFLNRRLAFAGHTSVVVWRGIGHEPTS